MTLPDGSLRQHIAVVGKTGSGKTYAAKGAIERLLDEQRRVCIIDPTGVWYGLRASADGRNPGYPVVVFGGEHADVPINDRSGDRLGEIIGARNLPAIIDLSEFTMGERHRFMTAFLARLHKVNRAPLHLVIDEADEVAPQNPLPETRRMLHEADRIVRRGRVRGFRVMLISQRPAVLHKNVLTQANTLIAMRLPAPQDRKAVEEWIKGQADQNQGKAVMASLGRLQRGEGWIWAPEEGVLERTTFPPIRTFDSGRTPDDGEAVAEPERLADVDLEGLAELLQAEEPDAKPVAAPPDPAALRREYDRGAEDGYRQGYRAGQVAAGQRAAGIFTRAVAAAEEAWSAGTKAWSDQIVEEAGRAPARTNGGGPGHIPGQPDSRHGGSRSTAAPKRAPEYARDHAQAVNGSQPPARQRILDALAWLEGAGITAPSRIQVALIAEAMPSSSYFERNLSALRTAGLIDYPGPGKVGLTAKGREEATPLHRPLSAADLHQTLRDRLPPARWRIVEALIRAYPGALDRASLAEAADATSSSSYYERNLSALRSLGLIDYPASGQVVAQPVLFLEG